MNHLLHLLATTKDVRDHVRNHCIVNRNTVYILVNWQWKRKRMWEWEGRTERCRRTGQTPDGPTRRAEIQDDLEECGERWSVIFKPSSILNRRIYLGGFHRTSGECYTQILKPRTRRGWINVSYINRVIIACTLILLDAARATPARVL